MMARRTTAIGMLVTGWLGALVTAAMPVAAQLTCTGDCDTNQMVEVDEMVIIVEVALGTEGLDACMAADAGGDDRVTIDEVVQARNNAVFGCGGTRPTPTPTPSQTPTPTTPAATPLGERVFSIRQDSTAGMVSRTAFLTSVLKDLLEFPNVSSCFSRGPLRLVAGVADENGVASLSVAEDTFIGLVALDTSIACLKIIAAGSTGTIDCDEGEHQDVILTQAAGRDAPPPELTVLPGAASGPGSVFLRAQLATGTLEAGSLPSECPTATFDPPFPVAFTTGMATGSKAQPIATDPDHIETISLEAGENFSCETWTMEDGPGMLVVPLVGFDDRAGGGVGNVLRIADDPTQEPNQCPEP
jgi:hypothetical protein